MAKRPDKPYKYIGESNNAMSVLFKHNITVYPVPVTSNTWNVEIDFGNGKKIKGVKIYNNQSLNKGLVDAINYAYEKIKNKI